MKLKEVKHCLRGFWLFVLLVNSVFSKELKAQIPVEVLVGNNQVQHEFFFFKDLDSEHKFNLFSMARFAVDYESNDLNSSFVSSQLTYNFNESWGVSSGGLFVENLFSPILALSYVYFNEKGDLFVNLFPTAIYNEGVDFELFGLFFYTPKLTEKFSLFSQVIFGTTVNAKFNEHLFSYQQIRIGLGYKDKFQFGLGLDQNFLGSDFISANNIGIFIRKEL